MVQTIELKELPPEMLVEITKNLDIQSIKRLEATCRSMHDMNFAEEASAVAKLLSEAENGLKDLQERKDRLLNVVGSQKGAKAKSDPKFKKNLTENGLTKKVASQVKQYLSDLAAVEGTVTEITQSNIPEQLKERFVKLQKSIKIIHLCIGSIKG